MKIYKLEAEKPRLGRKPKTPKVDQRILSKIGRGIYHCDNVKEIKMEVKFKDGSILAYQRGEEDDEYEDFRKSRLEGKGGHC